MTDLAATTSVTIGRALVSDAAGLSLFAARLFRETYSDDTAASDLDAFIESHFGPQQQAREIADPSGAVQLAVCGEDIAGYAYVTWGGCELSLAFLSRIYVDQQWRGQGVARQLLDAVIADVIRAGATKLQLTVFEKNPRAIAFYQRQGFAVTGTTTFPVGHDVQTDYVMERSL